MTFASHLDAATSFVTCNARPVERRLFEVLFASGGSASRAALVRSLLAYQNADGGLGNALEPDMRCSPSQPACAEYALRALDRAAAFGEAETLLVAPLLEWLEKNAPGGVGVTWATEGVASAPRAPWWQPSAETSFVLTARIAALLRRNGHAANGWVARSSEYVWHVIEGEQQQQQQKLAGHLELTAASEFVESALRGEEERAHKAAERLVGLARTKEIATDVEALESKTYQQGPLDWAPRPGGTFSALFDEEVIARHLKALEKRQQPDGGWPINWKTVSVGAETEWRGMTTINALLTLRDYTVL
eukprot:m51a1_g690 hypothetical protein (305) ;mRNA; f:333567-334481